MGKAPRFAVALAIALLTTVWAASFGGAAQEDQSQKKQGSNHDGVVNTAGEVYYQKGDGASGGQHPGPGGHLPPGKHNVVKVGERRVTHIQGRVADLAYRNDHAYLGAWSSGLPPGECTGGFWTVDISNPSRPINEGFRRAAQNTYYTEGMHTIRLETPSFTGNVLLASVESCGLNAPGTGGGLDIWDIRKPDSPVLISRGFGDYTSGDMSGDVDPNPHQAHSVFGWTVGNRAYAALIDNEDLYDVDILDITNPAAPVLVSETGFPEWPNVNVDAYGGLATSHDFVAKNINGTWHLMVAYWDAGWVDLNVNNPSNPTFIGETDYFNCDPVNPNACPPEGNGHQNEWNRGGNLFLGTDEDQSPFRLIAEVESGAHQGQYDAGEFSWTVPIVDLSDKSMNGPTIYGDYGCPDDRAYIPTAEQAKQMYNLQLGPDEELILVMQRGPVGDPNHPHDACFFSEKVETAQLLGYDGAIVANHHAGAQAGATPDAFICGSMGHTFEVKIPGVCIGHRLMHLLFDDPNQTNPYNDPHVVDPTQTYPPDYTFPYPEGDPGDVEPDVADLGAYFSATAVYDGWGYTHLFNANTYQEIDQLFTPFTNDPDFAQGFGDMSVHEVAVDKAKKYRRVAYFSWYAQGFRVAVFDRDEIRRSGFFIDEGGNDFWGVELCGRDAKGRRLVCASDRDFGLYVFRYTGPLQP